MSSRSWYLIHCKPRQEQVARDNLQRQEYECYLPMMRTRKRSGTSYKLVEEPMFARYLFIRLNSETDNWSSIRSTRGVQALVRFGMLPAKLPDEVVELIQQSQQESQQEEVPTPSFEPGQKVTLHSGAFAGYQAIFQQSSGSKRAEIMLEMAGRYNRLRVDIDSLDAAD